MSIVTKKPTRLQQLSIVMPVYNGIAYFEEAIASILASSCGASAELLVIDDASTDGTADLLKALAPSFRNLRYKSLPHRKGAANARNEGLALASNSIIGFLDADDRYVAGALDLMLQALSGPNTPDVVMGRVKALRSGDGTDRPESFSVEGPAVRCYQLGSILAQKKVIDSYGGFNPAYQYGEDVDWFFRLQEEGVCFTLIDDVVLHYRRHSSSMTAGNPAMAEKMAVVLQASLLRRRKIAAETGKSREEIYYVRPDVLNMTNLGES